MPKRRAISSDVEEQDGDDGLRSSPANKRARTTHEPEQPNGSKTKGKGKERREVDDEEEAEDADDAEEDMPDIDDEDDEEFEARHQDRVRASIEGMNKKKIGSIAQHGIIERIEMHQFMCHKFLNFTFGPQINFIVGHNGSGKSAVLSAITVALGGKATSTGRGSGLKAFIREGQGASEVSVTLKNQGEEAYKPDIYGASITITRRFTKDGSSSYKIKTKDGRVVSTKREELSNICDHMNLQVDNPMNILTQDSARQFLSASHPKDKYHFFLKGTQLSQLSEEYDICLENISRTTKILEVKKESIPALQQALREAKTKYQEASKAREQKAKSEELKRELAWAHVATKREELSTALEKVASQQRHIEKIEGHLQQSEDALALAREKVKEKEDRHNELGEVRELSEQSDKFSEQIKAGREKLSQIKGEEQQIKEDLRAENHTIEETSKQIAEESKKLEGHAQIKRDELHHKLEEARAAVRDHEERLTTVASDLREKDDERTRLKQEGQEAMTAHNAAKEKIGHLQANMEQLAKQQQNELAVYGNDIKVVLDRIQRGKWHGSTPVGPLGQYVKLRDPARHAEIMRVVIGGLMSAFAVTDPRDADPLRQILHATKNMHCNVIVAEDDPFDYSAGEPINGLTILRALDVSHPYVLRLLINSARIESTFLADTRGQAEQAINEYGGGEGVAFSLDGFQVRRYGAGGGSSNPVQWPGARDIRNMLFTSRDPAAQLRLLQEQYRAAELQYQETLARQQIVDAAFNNCARENDRLHREERSIHQALGQLRRTRDTLIDEVNEELPAGIAGLEEALRDAETTKEHLLAQYENLAIRKKEVDDAQKPLQRELERVKRQIRDFEAQRREALAAVEDAAVGATNAQKDITHYTERLDEARTALGTLEVTSKELESEFMEWSKDAREFCKGVEIENPRKAKTVQNNLDAIQRALKDRERRDGATVEEVAIELNKAKLAYDRARKDLRDMHNLNKVLRQSLYVRLHRWHEFRKHIALRCKMLFQYHLANRGYFGRVLFDHKEGKLELKVQTDEQAGTQSMDKDPKSLSGGEKSFSTICLLLSLWEAINCPLRCLDEFDVFMDAVNRRISMKMMIETAQASEGRQYILISPQDAGSIKPSASVRIHRMADPERGQTTLAF